MLISNIITKARQEKRVVLTEIEAKQILRAANIPCTDTQLAQTPQEAVALAMQFGYPVVMKISSHDITHKSDAGGVKINIVSKTQVEEAWQSIMQSARLKFPDAAIEGIAVQPMARPGIEIIMGMIKDPKFGPVLMFGLGGILVEVLEDVAFGIVPLQGTDALDMINQIKGKKLLEGYRGQEPADIPGLADMLMKVSAFVDQTPQIAEIDMNPIFAYKDGALVVDARIILAD